MITTLPHGLAPTTAVLLPGERPVPAVTLPDPAPSWQHVPTMTDARSPMRALRAALFAAVSVTLAAMGHSSLSAHHIPPTALLTALGVTAGAGWLAAGRRCGARSIGAGMLAVQGALHLIFAGGGQSAAHHGHQQTPPDAVTDTGMLTVHLAAAAGCALWLAHGEAAFFRLARSALSFAFTPLRLLLTTVVRLPETVPAPRPATRPHFAPGVPLAHTVVRRGPPAPALHRAMVPGAAAVRPGAAFPMSTHQLRGPPCPSTPPTRARRRRPPPPPRPNPPQPAARCARSCCGSTSTRGC
ncbi:hypothetical protein [Streptomyces sp. NPDC003023]|uniref:hypothetical protein n=1 Tax=Streptomyces sp. NPDC003023 TaxID=3364675 RepID=UPI0036BEE1D9